MLKNLFPSYIFNGDATTLDNFTDIQEQIQQYLDTKDPHYLPWFGKTHKLYEKSFGPEDANLLGYCPLLKSFIIDQITQFLLQVRPDQSEFFKTLMNYISINSSWATQFDDGDYAHQHNHLPDEISGVYYYQVPEQDPLNKKQDNRYEGHLYFVSPLTGHYTSLMTAPLQKVYVTPQKGQLILFPSYLEHGVMTCHNKDKSRISISFNVSIHRNFIHDKIEKRDKKEK